MDVRRIRPLFLPPHPRRNQYTPIYIKVSCIFCSFVRAEPFKTPRGVLIGW